MKPWTRDDTKDWINLVLGRFEDFEYYRDRTLDYCENHLIEDPDLVTKCVVATLIWVAAHRNETLSFTELLDLLHVPLDDNLTVKDRQIIIPTEELTKLDHQELLQVCLNS